VSRRPGEGLRKGEGTDLLARPKNSVASRRNSSSINGMRECSETGFGWDKKRKNEQTKEEKRQMVSRKIKLKQEIVKKSTDLSEKTALV